MARRPRRSFSFSGLVLLLVSIAGLAILQACETPVYRYAMYRWKPAPYEIYYFHQQPINEQTRLLHEGITKLTLAKPDQPLLNATLITVDLAEDPELQKVLPDIKELWTKHQDQLSPGYLVTNPQGGAVSIGSFDPSKLQHLTTSPGRQQLLKQLADGRAAVMVILNGPDAAGNRVAQQEVQKLVESVNQGEVQLYQVPEDPDAKDANNQETTSKPAHTLGLLSLDRDDPAEAWLVQSLLAVEGDLKDLHEPMVFAVYGRARALPPYVGKGITRENLLECIEFVTGACSCTVKEQNPGVDLLIQSDWEGMAARIAEKFGAEEGNESQLGGDEFFPELIIGSGTQSTAEAGNKVDLRIYCANELRHPLGEIVKQYEAEHDVSIAVNYGNSAELLAMIELDKKGDIYLAGDHSFFTQASEKGLTTTSIPLAKRKPVIAVAHDNQSVQDIKDLLNSQVNVAIGNPDEGSIGPATRQLLTASGHWEELASHVADHGIFETSVDDILDAVKQGRVTAGIIWDTTAGNDPDLKLLPVPELDAGESSIEIAVLNCSTATAAAKQFTQFVASPKQGLTVFKDQGFRLAATANPADLDASRKTENNTSEGVDTSTQVRTGWTVGIGVLAGLILLAGITFFVIRPR